MPYNAGTYTLPVNSWNPAVANTVINPTDWNSTGVDLSSALSTAILKDGTQTTTARIPFASGIQTDSITELTSGNGVSIAKVNWSLGSDVTSASTIDLTAATGQIVDVTGTTGISAVTLGQGQARWVRFTGALTITAGASLILPTTGNITTAAGDYALFVGYASSVVRLAQYQKKSGNSINGDALVWSSISGDTTAANNNGYMIDTSSAVVTLTLPLAPTEGNIVQVTDAAGTFATNNLTVARNSEKIMGLSENMTVSTNNAAFGLVYQSSANGWRLY